MASTTEIYLLTALEVRSLRLGARMFMLGEGSLLGLCTATFLLRPRRADRERERSVSLPHLIRAPVLLEGFPLMTSFNLNLHKRPMSHRDTWEFVTSTHEFAGRGLNVFYNTCIVHDLAIPLLDYNQQKCDAKRHA